MQIVLIGRVEDVQTVQTRTGLQTSCQKFRLCLGTRFSLATIDEIFIKHISQMINTIYIHEGKSLNNRNFIITILQECLQKLFVSYFPKQSPPLRNTPGPPVHKLADALQKKKLFGVASNQLRTASITSSSSANLWPHKCSFIAPNK